MKTKPRKYISITDPHYATRMMRIVKRAESKPPINPDLGVNEKELWRARGSGRRGKVLSATQFQVIIEFDETCLLSRHSHSRADFLRLYVKC